MRNGKIREWGEQSLESNWIAAGQFKGHAALFPEAGRDAHAMWRTLKRQIAEAWAACGAFEWTALAYLAASSVSIALFAKNLGHPWRLLGTQAMVAALVLTLCRVQARSAARAEVQGVSFSARWWHFWRHWYPHLFFLFCFEELAYLMTLFTPHWQDPKLIAFDYWLTGVHPSLWLEQFATTPRNEFMQLVYLSYFTYLLILGGILYVRHEWQAYWSAMTYSMAGYTIGYFIAMFFPVESPWFAMAGSWHAPLSGGPVTTTVNFIEHFGRVRGAAFPSEHVAGATAALWGAWRFRRRLFWVLLPVFLCMCVSTIWGRYHYMADVFAGMTTGTLGFLIGSRIMRRQGAVKTAPATAAP
jgi:membrane-associated phospholipid phosphatase